MQSDEAVDAYFQKLITRCDSRGRPTSLPQSDQVIYYVIATRCEMDMNGFNSVFDQLLDEKELRFLIGSLNDLGESNLAKLFDSAYSRLKDTGFFESNSIRVSDFDSDDEIGILEDIAQEIRKDNALWSMDEKLVELLPESAR